MSVFRRLESFPQLGAYKQFTFGRSFGIWSSIQGKIQDTADATQLKQFKDQIARMLDGPKYSLTTWNSEMEEAMSSWRMKIPGAKSSAEVQKLMVFQEIIAKMTPAQKENPLALKSNHDSLKRIAIESGKTVDDVVSLLQRFQMLSTYQEWVQKRKADGKRLPKDMDDMQALLKVDMEKDKIKVMRSRARRF